MSNSLLFVLTLPLAAQVNVPTYQYDLTRAGANRRETILTHVNVNPTSFGKLFSDPVDGYIFGQPLYLTVNGRNIVYVATEHDSVYAFDADQSGPPIWHVNFLDADAGITTVPIDENFGCDQVSPEIGITSTPVIDPAGGTIYVVAMTRQSGRYMHHLHALDVATGAEKPGSPVLIQATYPGTGEGGTTLVFDPRNYKQRPGLLLLNGVVYTAWSSHCDGGVYHGWLIGYDARTLRQVAIYNNTPDGNQASFWAGGAAPAVDGADNIYLVGGNGSFNYAFGGTDLGESYIKLSTRGGLAVEDYFTPFNYAQLNDEDTDVGSAGVVLLGDEAGSSAHRHLMAGAGKEGRIYLLDRDKMGHWQAGSDSQIVATTEANFIAGMFGNPAYFNHSLYFCGSGDPVKAFSVYDAVMSKFPGSQSSVPYDYPGCVPSISANGTSDAIVWVLSSYNTLQAFDARNVAVELYNSDQNRARDAMGKYVKFTPPAIVNGKVYVGTQASLDVYGLLPGVAPPLLLRNAASGERGVAAPGSILSVEGEFPASTALDTSSLTVGGAAARLFSAGPRRIDLLVPPAAAIGETTVTVGVGGRQVASGTLRIQAVAPGIFMAEQGRAKVENTSVAPGGELAIYLTGLGASTNVSARVGEKDARVVFAGPTAGYAGLSQVNLIVPEELAPGDYPVFLIVDGIVSNSAVIRVGQPILAMLRVTQKIPVRAPTFCRAGASAIRRPIGSFPPVAQRVACRPTPDFRRCARG